MTIGPGTKIRKQGQRVATAPAVGDRVLVQARVCKADLMGTTLPPLVAQGAKGADDEEKEKEKA